MRTILILSIKPIVLYNSQYHKELVIIDYPTTSFNLAVKAGKAVFQSATMP
jgi:hypothetical protein